MDDEDNDYELERQKTIAENRLLLDSLGLDPSGASKIPGATPKSKLAKPSTPSSSSAKKRKAVVVKHEEGPRRRSGRLAGLEATGEEIAKREEEDAKEREILRVINRKEREQVMNVGDMVEDSSPGEKEELDTYLKQLAKLKNPRRYPSASTPAKECYDDKDSLPAEVKRLQAQFKGMTLRANAKVTSERVFSMVVHPEKTKTVVLAADKYGLLGIWDALGKSDEKVKDEDDTTGTKLEDDDDEQEEGRVWHVQAHARSAISCMKVDPINGSGLFSSSYDCSLRHLDFATTKSTELFAFTDDDTLITHFDLVPNGNEAWIADRNGGISHCDFRQSRGKGGGGGERRRWEVSGEGRAVKLGGLSVNPMLPHLVVTAGNDQHLRIWDIRNLSTISPKAADTIPPPSPTVKLDSESAANGDVKPDVIEHFNTSPSSSIPYEKVSAFMSTQKGKGLLRAAYQHGKSCSSAYWDPWGRRILSTSYDDKLRVWNVNPQSFLLESTIAPSHFQPSRTVAHNCQTGRWLTILRANWSLNMDYMPHFTVGNMKRRLDVIASTGDKIVSLWTDGVSAVPAVTSSHPSRVDHLVGGNTSGRIQLWTSGGE